MRGEKSQVEGSKRLAEKRTYGKSMTEPGEETSKRPSEECSKSILEAILKLISTPSDPCNSWWWLVLVSVWRRYTRLMEYEVLNGGSSIRSFRSILCSRDVPLRTALCSIETSILPPKIPIFSFPGDQKEHEEKRDQRKKRKEEEKNRLHNLCLNEYQSITSMNNRWITSQIQSPKNYGSTSSFGKERSERKNHSNPLVKLFPDTDFGLLIHWVFLFYTPYIVVLSCVVYTHASCEKMMQVVKRWDQERHEPTRDQWSEIKFFYIHSSILFYHWSVLTVSSVPWDHVCDPWVTCNSPYLSFMDGAKSVSHSHTQRQTKGIWCIFTDW